MKRKIIKQGHNTLTITLPSKWAKQFNVQPGDEVDLIEKESGLFISKEKNSDGHKIEINIEGLDIPTIWKYFMAAYREGYDEIKIIYNPTASYESPYKFFTSHAIDIKYGKKPAKKTPFETVQDIINRFIGLEIIQHHKDYCIVKDMAELSSKEFDSSLRRVFLLTQQMGEEIIEAIKNNDSKILQHTHDIDINVDKFHDYCIRVLNKTGFKDIKQTHLLFSLLYVLEMLGDEFKNIAFHIIEDMKERNTKNLLQISQLTLEQFNNFYDLYYNFQKEKVVEMSQRDMEIYFFLPKLYKKKGKKSELSDEELEIFNHFRRIGKYVNSLVELRIEMEH